MAFRQLTHLRKGEKVAEYLLDVPDVVIGRGRSAQARLDGNPVVSRQHCMVRLRGDVHVVEDLGGANGTFVNGQAVKTHPLRVGDRIVLGEDALRYDFAVRTAISLKPPSNDDAGQVEALPLESFEELHPVDDLQAIGATNRARGSELVARGQDSSERTAVARRDQLEEMLRVMQLRARPHLVVPAGAGEELVPLGQGPVRIGHGEGCHVKLPGSRWLPGKVPVELFCEGPRWAVVPTSPFWNPVTLQGQRIRKVRLLEEGDTIQVEGFTMVFRKGEQR